MTETIANVSAGLAWNTGNTSSAWAITTDAIQTGTV